MVTDTIDGVLIEEDENGFHLILSGMRAEYRFNVHGVALELLRAAEREIVPWRAEMQESARELGADLHPFEPRDPKHPDHHDVMAEASDSRDAA